MFYKVMVSNFFLEHIFLVEEQNEGCVLQPILELNLSEYFYWLLQSVRSLVVFSDEVGVVLVDGGQEDDAGHSLLRLHYCEWVFEQFSLIRYCLIKYVSLTYREELYPDGPLLPLAPDIRDFEIDITYSELVF